MPKLVKLYMLDRCLLYIILPRYCCYNYHKLYFLQRNIKTKCGEITYMCIIFGMQALDSEKLRLCLSSLTS